MGFTQRVQHFHAGTQIRLTCNKAWGINFPTITILMENGITIVFCFSQFVTSPQHVQYVLNCSEQRPKLTYKFSKNGHTLVAIPDKFSLQSADSSPQ